MPSHPKAWWLLADVEPEQAAEYWRRVVETAPARPEARIRLAVEAEAEGRAEAAEALLREAAAVDAGFAPAWALTNFFYRQERWPEFWLWASHAALVSEGDLMGLLHLCLRAEPDPERVAQRLFLDQEPAREQLLRAALERGLAREALPVAKGLDRNRLAEAADWLLTQGDAATARRYWNLAYPGERGITNADFQQTASGKGFDWRLAPRDQAIVRTGDGARIELSGSQPERVTVLSQVLAVEPGGDYVLRYRYRSQFGPDASRARWRVEGQQSPPLTASQWTEATWRFQLMAGGDAKLDLAADREPGRRRSEGALEISWVRISVP
jgi:hypothetical protein